MNNLILTLSGPTASGKTHVAIELAKKFPLEIISVDSAMIYKHMDIGTGKPTTEELAVAPHHLINILEPTQYYSIANFRNDALALIEKIHQKNKIPFLVGGTMLYFNGLIHGTAELPKTDVAIRKQLKIELNCMGLTTLYENLKNVDPTAAATIHPNDQQRILRALEVYTMTGRPISSFWQNQAGLIEHAQLYQFAIFPDDRSLLHQNISNRFQTMLQLGFVGEVQKLKARNDLSLELPSMRAVGYRQIWKYLEGELDYQTMQDNAVAATRQLAKRQLTWLRHWKNIQLLQNSTKALEKMSGLLRNLAF